jgi:hypothetical protein
VVAAAAEAVQEVPSRSLLDTRALCRCGLVRDADPLLVLIVKREVARSRLWARAST